MTLKSPRESLLFEYVHSLTLMKKKGTSFREKTIWEEMSFGYFFTDILE